MFYAAASFQQPRKFWMLQGPAGLVVRECRILMSTSYKLRLAIADSLKEISESLSKLERQSCKLRTVSDLKDFNPIDMEDTIAAARLLPPSEDATFLLHLLLSIDAGILQQLPPLVWAGHMYQAQTQVIPHLQARLEQAPPNWSVLPRGPCRSNSMEIHIPQGADSIVLSSSSSILTPSCSEWLSSSTLSDSRQA